MSGERIANLIDIHRPSGAIYRSSRRKTSVANHKNQYFVAIRPASSCLPEQPKPITDSDNAQKPGSRTVARTSGHRSNNANDRRQPLLRLPPAPPATASGHKKNRPDRGRNDSPGGGQGRGRTGDLPLFRRTLYQLSYLARTPVHHRNAVATLTGLEPATFAVTGRRANQLRHRAMSVFSYTSAPNGIRTRVAALKGRSPRPLDDGSPIGSADRPTALSGPPGSEHQFTHPETPLRRGVPKPRTIPLTCEDSIQPPVGRGIDRDAARHAATTPRQLDNARSIAESRPERRTPGDHVRIEATSSASPPSLPRCGNFPPFRRQKR